MKRRLILILAVALLQGALLSAAPPSPWDFLGYESGARFTPYHRIVEYFETLDAQSEMIRVETYGETWEGRPLTLVVIGSSSNMERLDEIRANLDALADPRITSLEEARRLAGQNPAVVWLAFGIHGNESSSAEAAMVTAHWLLSDEAAAIREDAIVLIDPLENPDGRERYVNWFHQKLGTEPNPSPEAIEHNEPWPGGRYNHYLLDMNRDWAWASQPETRGRIEVFKRWHPQVVVDLHEMGYDSTYFFPPSAAPINANIDPDVTGWLETFGRANAEVFSSRGWPFFVREHFDLFYPGYGDSWPSLRGAIGMTYEVAGHGRAGLVVEREDGTTWTLAERIEQHSTAAITTVTTAASNKEELLMHLWSAGRTSMLNPRTFFLSAESTAFDDAIDLLTKQGIELGFLREPFSTRAIEIGTGREEVRSFPPGTAVVSTTQPLGGFVKALLEQNPALPPEFVDEQRERVDADEYAEFYDLTGWSIPLAFNVETWEARGAVVPARIVARDRENREGSFLPASYGWLVDGRDPAAYRTAAALHRRGVRFGIVPEEARVDGRQFARGTLAVLRYKNVDDLDRILEEIAEDEKATFFPVEQGWVGDLTLGSDSIERFVDPGIVLVGGSGTDPTSFGSLWYTLDVTVDFPHTVIDLDRLSRIDLSSHKVIVLPDGWGYGGTIQGDLKSKLRDWVQAGGTIVAIKGAAAALRGDEEALSEIKERDGDDEGEDPDPGQQRYTEFHVPGAAFATEVRRRDHLSFGLAEDDPAVLIEGDVALELAPHAVANIVTISETTPLVAGLAWPESIESVAGSPWLTSERLGRGRIITFADEPHYRLFWKGTLPFFLNAVMYTPSFVN